MKILIIIICLGILTAGCQQGQNREATLSPSPARADSVPRTPEAVSLLGDTLYAPELSAGRRAQYDSALAVAQQNYRNAPEHPENIVWWGRRLGYLGRYQEAIRVFSDGLAKFPESAELYRHRGHRYITTRQFERAVGDLKKSAQLLENQTVRMEPNGIPIPLPPNDQPASLQFNVYYHLGLAYYLTGQYGPAAEAYETCLTYANTDDETVAVADWLYMTYRRLGEDEVAERTLALIRQDMNVQENEGYYERLLMYKGYLDPDSLMQIDPGDDLDLKLATAGYGLGNYYLSEGDTLLGREIFQNVIDGRYWAAFGYIAAEADLARRRR